MAVNIDNSVLKIIVKDLEDFLFDKARKADISKGFDEPLLFVVDHVEVKPFTLNLKWLFVKYSSERSEYLERFLLRVFEIGKKGYAEEIFGNALDFFDRVEDVFEDIRAIKPLKYGSSYMVFESFNGESFMSSTFPYDKKLELAGLALSVFHGVGIEQNNPEMEEKRVVETLKPLPLSGEEKLDLKRLFDGFIFNIAKSYGSVVSFNNFTSTNLFFELLPEEEERAIVWLVSSENFNPFVKSCRLEDIATFFIKQVIQEFKSGNINLSRTKQDLNWFLRGYNRFLDDMSSTRIEEFYEGSLPLEFHIAIEVLKSPENIVPNQLQDTITFVKRLLKERPLTSDY